MNLLASLESASRSYEGGSHPPSPYLYDPCVMARHALSIHQSATEADLGRYLTVVQLPQLQPYPGVQHVVENVLPILTPR